MGSSRVVCGRHANQTRNSGGMGVKKDFRIEVRTEGVDRVSVRFFASIFFM